MAKEKKVEQITDMEVDFAQWYTDICRKAELVEYASVKGFTILRPYGYAIWENIQRIMDAEFKKTGHVNVAMPVLQPVVLRHPLGEDDPPVPALKRVLVAGGPHHPRNLRGGHPRDGAAAELLCRFL